jgi:SAM-dependent MidA family methyltransferase
MDKHLPKPSDEALKHSERLVAQIRASMQDGSISFADYMQQCLYAPGLGYYVAGSQKFGEAGDFITAPMISPLYSYTLAQSIMPTLQSTQGAILELGAGNGQMAADILSYLQTQGDTTTEYLILEVSPDCQAQQKATLEKQIPEALERVTWLQRLPEDFKGVMLANEVLDAMPVHLFRYQEQELLERRVIWQDNCFDFSDEPMQDEVLRLAIAGLPLTEQDKDDYISEINLTLPIFARSLIAKLQQGMIVFADYGFLQDVYYHHDRKQGTLMCHYRHHAHADPFIYPGLQDITAHVDFTKVGETALHCGLQVSFDSQAEYLLSHGLLDLAATEDTEQQLRYSQQIQKLVQAHEMGELFKVMCLFKKL